MEAEVLIGRGIDSLYSSRSFIKRLKVREVRGMNHRLSHPSLCCATQNMACNYYHHWYIQPNFRWWVWFYCKSICVKLPDTLR